jgi:hypothetical protein
MISIVFHKYFRNNYIKFEVGNVNQIYGSKRIKKRAWFLCENRQNQCNKSDKDHPVIYDVRKNGRKTKGRNFKNGRKNKRSNCKMSKLLLIEMQNVERKNVEKENIKSKDRKQKKQYNITRT